MDRRELEREVLATAEGALGIAVRKLRLALVLGAVALLGLGVLALLDRVAP